MRGSNFNLYRRKDGIGNIVVLSFRDEAAKKGKKSSTLTKIRARNERERERENEKKENNQNQRFKRGDFISSSACPLVERLIERA